MSTSLLRGLRWGFGRHGEGRARRKPHRNPTALRRTFAPHLGVLEDRTLPSTFTVLNLADSGPGSLRQAILDANAEAGADDVRFDPAASDGTIALTGGQLDITDDLTIDGPGRGRLTVSGNQADRVFRVEGADTDVAIAGLTIADGRAADTVVTGPYGPVTAGGGILNRGGHLTLSRVTFRDNQADGQAAGFLALGRAAALAAGGRGVDAAGLHDADRARLRRHALDWLRAVLTRLAKDVEGGKPRERIEAGAALRTWLRDPALVSIRDQAALAPLPAEEREACQKLWADVEMLLAKVRDSK